MLLQILDDGILTDSQGRKVDFKNCIIIMTSNIGAKQIAGSGSSSLGFGSEKGGSMSDERIKEAVMGELKNAFRPEFLNRVDDIIVFRKLQKEDIEQIAKRMLDSLAKRVASMQITISFDDAAVGNIADAGFDPVYGARPLRRAIQSKIEDKLSEEILEGRINPGDNCVCKADGKEFVFEKV